MKQLEDYITQYPELYTTETSRTGRDLTLMNCKQLVFSKPHLEKTFEIRMMFSNVMIQSVKSEHIEREIKRFYDYAISRFEKEIKNTDHE